MIPFLMKLIAVKSAGAAAGSNKGSVVLMNRNRHHDIAAVHVEPRSGDQWRELQHGILGGGRILRGSV